MRAAAVAAAIYQQGLAVGRNQQNGVALAHIDGLDEQGVAGVIDGAWQDGNNGGQKQRGPCSAAGPAGSRRNGPAGQNDGCRKQRAEGERLPKQRRGNAKVAERH